MVRIPRRAHSVSGPSSAQCVLKDVACCCNMIKIHHFYMSIMALRRNPQRKCRKEEVVSFQMGAAEVNIDGTKPVQHEPGTLPEIVKRDPISRYHIPLTSTEPFRFFDLPREVRDHVYSYLVVRRGRMVPIIEAKGILRGQKKRATALRTRDRLNQKRALNGRRPIAPKEYAPVPLVDLNLLQASRILQFEARDYLYQNNWFAISLDSFPVTTIDAPSGWDFSRITKLQLELQLKDAQRMNSYVDWITLFASFPLLRFIRIIPTFHPRYYDWAHAEIATWETTHFIFRAFFRELLASIPESIKLNLGPSMNPEENMCLEGRSSVSRIVLQHMYAEIGARRSSNGRYLAVDKVVDCEDGMCMA